MDQLLPRILGPNLGHSLIISPADKVIMATDNSPSRQDRPSPAGTLNAF